jgi:hypothetical protein
MGSNPIEFPSPHPIGPDLVSQAAAVLARETARLADLLGRTGSIDALNASQPASGAADDSSRHQLYDFLQTLLDGLRVPGEHPAVPQVPLAASNAAELRRRAHDLIEALLSSATQAGRGRAATYEEQVPLIRCAGAVDPGGEAHATMRIANEEATAAEVTLYSTNLIADSGYDISSSRVTVSPRRAIIPPNGEAAVEIRVAVPQQTPTGHYSCLIQASGCKYVKAVLLVEVL